MFNSEQITTATEVFIKPPIVAIGYWILCYVANAQHLARSTFGAVRYRLAIAKRYQVTSFKDNLTHNLNP